LTILEIQLVHAIFGFLTDFYQKTDTKQIDLNHFLIFERS